MSTDYPKLSSAQREALYGPLGGGLPGWLTRLRADHRPTFAKSRRELIYAGCSCGDVRCSAPLFLVHIDDLIDAFEAKVGDLAAETARSSGERGDTPADDLRCNTPYVGVGQPRDGRPCEVPSVGGRHAGVHQQGDLWWGNDDEPEGDTPAERDRFGRPYCTSCGVVLVEPSEGCQSCGAPSAPATAPMGLWQQALSEFPEDEATRRLRYFELMVEAGHVLLPDDPAPSAPVLPEPDDEPAAWNDLLVCERCLGPLAQPGALLFSPPTKDGTVRKHHVCHWCYPVVLGEWQAHHASMRIPIDPSAASSPGVEAEPQADEAGAS